MKTILEKIRDLVQLLKYKLSGKEKYIVQVETRIRSLKNNKRADLIEVELRKKLMEPNLLKYEKLYLEWALEILTEKRKSL